MNTRYVSVRWLLVGCLVLLVSGAVWAAQTRLQVAVGDDEARVNYLKAKAAVVREGTKRPVTLKVGDALVQGDRVITGTGSRIELKLPDGSLLRFDERTTFVLVATTVDRRTKKRDISFNVVVGKTWARVSKLFGRRGRFDLATPTAVAGVRGTTYRMNVNDDNSAMVKVYDGEVEVKKREKAAATAAAPPVLSEPKEIEGPRVVTVEEWVYLVGALQQININPDGTATKPFRFDIKADLNEWVKWNQMRDSEVEATE
jgi:ferric-dicitrate binding protein FerR (iron transport regulator)